MKEWGPEDYQHQTWERFHSTEDHPDGIAWFDELADRRFQRYLYTRQNPDGSETTYTSYLREFGPADPQDLGLPAELQMRAAAADIRPVCSPLIIPLGIDPDGNIWPTEAHFAYEHHSSKAPTGHQRYTDSSAAFEAFSKLSNSFMQSSYIGVNPDGSETAYTSYEKTLKNQEYSWFHLTEFRMLAALAGLREAFPPLVIPIHVDGQLRSGAFDRIYLQLGYEHPTRRFASGTVESPTPLLSHRSAPALPRPEPCKAPGQ
jgi:hypothetical protein